MYYESWASSRPCKHFFSHVPYLKPPNDDTILSHNHGRSKHVFLLQRFSGSYAFTRRSSTLALACCEDHNTWAQNQSSRAARRR